MNKAIKELLHDLDTTDLEKWCSTTVELANFGSSAIETLCHELLRSIESIKMPYGVVQRNPVISLQEFNKIAQKFSEIEKGTLVGKDSVVINIQFNKAIGEKASIQNTISYRIIYAGEGAEVNMATAEEIWVAPDRKVNYVYAKYIFAGFPLPSDFPKEAFYEVDDPADGIMASGYNRAWGIIDALMRIKDKKAIPVLQLVSKKTESTTIRKAALECIEKIK